MSTRSNGQKLDPGIRDKLLDARIGAAEWKALGVRRRVRLAYVLQYELKVEQEEDDGTDLPQSFDQFEPGTCVNCGAIAAKGKLFCGERCRQTGELIRWMRRKVAEGTTDRPDIVEAFRNRAALLVGGGYYDRENRKESEEVKEALRKRAQGKCEKCGRVFGDEGDSRFTVQHTVTKKGVKLEAWCWRCNMDDARARMHPISDVKQLRFAKELRNRIWSPKPLYFVDDPEAWTKSCRDLLRIARHPRVARGGRRLRLPQAR